MCVVRVPDACEFVLSLFTNEMKNVCDSHKKMSKTLNFNVVDLSYLRTSVQRSNVVLPEGHQARHAVMTVEVQHRVRETALDFDVFFGRSKAMDP